MNPTQIKEQAKEYAADIQNLQEEINSLTLEASEEQSKIEAAQESLRAISTLIKQKQSKQQRINDARKELLGHV